MVILASPRRPGPDMRRQISLGLTVMKRFDATIERAPRGGAYVTVPDSIVAALGGGKRVSVVANFEGIDYRGSMVRMGGAHILGVAKDIRARLDKDVGNSVAVSIELDTADRTVAVPEALEHALAAASLTDVFGALSLSHRREYIDWIEEAKKAETRSRRIDETVRRLLEA